MGAVVRGERSPFGLIVNDTSGAGTTYRHAGGEGVCLWKTLVNGSHVEGDWNVVEHLVVEPGGSVGEHVHTRTEEIYYVLRGRAVMTVDGVQRPVVAGDLITAPIGTAHAIANHDPEDVHLFVVEVFPRAGPAADPVQMHMPDLVTGPAERRRAVVDLTPHFTGAWRTVRLIEVPDGGGACRDAPSESAEVLFVVAGAGELEVGGRRVACEPGRCLAVQPGMAWTARAVGALSLISTEVEVR